MSGDDSQNEIELTTASMACPVNESQNEATLTTTGLVCPADTCGKKLKTKQTLSKHMDKFHKDTTDKVTQLDSPARLALFRLREDGGDPRTQGNRNGEVNSPKVVSPARYVCSSCDNDYPKKEEVIKHIAEAHSPENAVTTDHDEDISVDEEGLVEACELYEALEALTKELKEESYVADDKEEMLRKIERFQMLAKKKTDIQKESIHEIKMLKQVEAQQRIDIDRKDKEITGLKKAAKSDKDKFKKDLEVLQKKNSDVVKENGNINAMLKEKQSMIVALEEQLSPEDDNESSVIEEVVTMGNNSSGHKCTLCNTKFSTNEDLERHIRDKHTEIDCPFSMTRL